MRAALAVAFLLAGTIPAAADFREEQLGFARVRGARDEKAAAVRELFEKAGVGFPPREIFIRVFKDERLLELWARPLRGAKFALVKAYPVCEASGDLGPKRKQGDLQVPEGFYRISGFNPFSIFHLSLRVDYPNAADRRREGARGLGGDIFIHGNCVSIGCVAITDDGIKELYWAAVEARAAGQGAIPVHLFPFRMSEENLERNARAAGADDGLRGFWRNLMEGYEQFEKNLRPPAVSVDAKGRYRFGR
jgi:murein L,D-transpeptidase YafK